MADHTWAANGKETDGVGTNLTISLATPWDLSGIMLWNGYQRSATHYTANSRVAEYEVTVNDTAKFRLAVKDSMAAQILPFPHVQKDVKSLRLTVARIYKGSAYKDLVVSELRLIDGTGRFLFLDVQIPRPEVTDPNLDRMLDRSFSPLAMGINSDDFPRRRLRIRSNGSFVAYENGVIMEGNWEPQAGGVRIFGKKYLTNPRDSEYLQAVKEKTSVKIFQASLSMIDLASTPYKEARQYLKPILADRGYYKLAASKDKPPSFDWWCADGDQSKITGRTEEELMQKVYQKAAQRKALLLYSPLFTDFFIPADEAHYYGVYDMGE